MNTGKNMTKSIIVGTGSFIPEKIVLNRDFLNNEFFDVDRKPFDKTNEEIIEKFEKITGISERRYVTEDQVNSDIAYYAARDALESSSIDPESLDYLICAHNFGDVKMENRRSDFVPSLAARVKEKLRIKSPGTVCYDLAFGCPGWLQGMIQADYFLKSGDAQRAMIIGTETLSRISDPHDRDSMLYADGAGATILESGPKSGAQDSGILSHAVRSDTLEHAYMLRMDESYKPDGNDDNLYLKMMGHRLYEYALKTVPLVVKQSIEKAKLKLREIKKVLIHQANEKMDESILNRINDLFREKIDIHEIMPMTISWLGNSSVATLPTLLDLIMKGKHNHKLEKGDVIVFASVGAGMNVNAMVYRI
jgi:3-oxoacyl-[acyl-carrier-protein] synthase-3